jgi:hypothetical protein
MIGLPKDNKVRLSYSNDGITFASLGAFTFTADTSKAGVVEAVFDVKDVMAQYIGIDYDFGPSGSTTDGKVVFEFTGLTEAGIVETQPRTYTAGVNNFSYAPEVVANKALDVLTDGNKVTDATGFSNAGIVLFQNKVCTNKEINPTVDLVLNLGETKQINKVVLNFYHEYNSMIGLPKNNAVRLTYSTDGVNFSDLGRYTFTGKAEKDKLGVIEAAFDVRTGTPHAIASRGGKPNPSYKDGNTKAAALA